MPKVLMSRKFICDRLHISMWQSRMLFKSDVGQKIFDAQVLGLLRTAAANRQPVGEYIPGDLLTPSGIAAELGVKRAWVMRMLKNRRHSPPHFRINKHTILFSRSAVSEWLSTTKSRRHCHRRRWAAATAGNQAPTP